jgi:uncharacterized protein (DUF983 family)
MGCHREDADMTATMTRCIRCDAHFLTSTAGAAHCGHCASAVRASDLAASIVAMVCAFLVFVICIGAYKYWWLFKLLAAIVQVVCAWLFVVSFNDYRRLRKQK